MAKELLAPDYIFEASWEVCNKVGGIYTVLSTRAKTLQEAFKDKVFFIGPDFWAGKENPLFSENENLCAAWREHALKKDGLNVYFLPFSCTIIRLFRSMVISDTAF